MKSVATAILLLFVSVTLITGHPLHEESSVNEKRSEFHGKPITGMTSSSTQSPVPSSFRRSKLLSSRRRINSRMMVDPQLPSESSPSSRSISYPESVAESSGTYRTTDERESTNPIVGRSSRRRRIESMRRATPLTRSAASDQSREQNPSRQLPYIFPISSQPSSPSNTRRATQLRKKVTPGFTTDRKKNISAKRGEKDETADQKDVEITSEGVSSNPPEFEEVRNKQSIKLDMNTMGRFMSNPKRSSSLIDLASYRRVSSGQEPVFYGNDMIFHREPSYDDEESSDTSRTRNSLSIDPNSEFVLIKK